MRSKLYKCKKCSFEVCGLRKFRSHSARSHRKALIVTTDSLTEETVQNISEAVVTEFQGSEIFTCSKCSRNFIRKGPFTRHSNCCKGVSHTNNEDHNDHEGVHDSELISNPRPSVRVDRPRRPIRSVVPCALEGHYQCPVCKQNFSRVGNLLRHLKHSSCASNPTLSHLNSQPSSERKPVKANNSLVRYKCPHCPKSYIYQGAMVQHVRGHSQMQRVGRFTCHVCQKAFRHNSELEYHYKTHIQSNHVCQICGRQFKYSWNLQVHEQTHSFRRSIMSSRTSQHLFTCQYCGKTFSHKLEAKKHVKVHTSLHHLCSFCGKEYFTRGSLCQHIEVAHFRRPSEICFDPEDEDTELDSENEDAEIFDATVDEDILLEEKFSASFSSPVPSTSCNIPLAPEKQPLGAGDLDNDTLSSKVQHFISILTDNIALQELIEPGVPVSDLLEKVIQYYGLNPVNCKEYPNGEGLRKNCRLLFAALLDDETVDELLVYFMKAASLKL